MKTKKSLLLAIMLLIILFISACSIQKDDLEGATIYTTVYPINYLTNYLYSDYGTISSIYPKDCDINSYSLTEKQIKNYAKADLFIYNGLTSEKEIAKKLLNKNKDMLIIDVSYGLKLNNDSTELWLSPNNYLMLAKNIRDNLKEYIKSKVITESIDKKFNEFEENISIMDALLHSYGSNAKANDKNIIIASNNTFKYLNNYGFNVLSLEDNANLKENKLNAIKNNFKSQRYKYILKLSTDEDTELLNDLTTNYGAKIINVDALTISLDDDYFNIMTDLIENIKLASC